MVHRTQTPFIHYSLRSAFDTSISLLIRRHDILSGLPSNASQSIFPKVSSYHRNECLRLQSQESHAGDRLVLAYMVINAYYLRTKIPDEPLHRYQLGGEVPPFMEIHCPSLNTRVKIDIPSTDGRELSAAFPVFERRNIVNLCQKSLRTVQDYDVVIARIMAEGSTLELAWRWGTNLDWVWQCDDVEGKYRDWAILCGLAMTQVGSEVIGIPKYI